MTQPGDEVVQRLPLPEEVSDPDIDDRPATPTAGGGVRRLVIEIVETLVLTAVIFFVIQTFVAQPFEVKQMSMERTLEPGHYVLVDKLTPRFDAYHLGDIVVFDPPETWSDGGTPFIKRVIGRAGDRVEILDSGQVAVNGTVLDEPYLFRTDPSGPTDPTETSGVTVVDGRRGRAVRDGRPSWELDRLAGLRDDPGRQRRRPGVAALLAVRRLRTGRRHRQRDSGGSPAD